MNTPGIALRRFTATLFGLAMAACTLAYAESREPLYVPPEICDLVVVANHETGDVRVSWSGGKSPFIVVRSDTEDLRLAKKLEVVAPAVRTKELVDRRAFFAGRRLFYQVFDRNSQPDIFGFTPDGGIQGAEITVRGVGFRSDCSKITVRAGGVEAPDKLRCGFLGFTFKVPANGMTGYLLIATPAGAADAGMATEETCNGKPRRPRSW